MGSPSKNRVKYDDNKIIANVDHIWECDFLNHCFGFVHDDKKSNEYVVMPCMLPKNAVAGTKWITLRCVETDHGKLLNKSSFW